MSVSLQPRYASWLWILLGFFCFRVSAQLIQSVYNTPFLPPFAAWQSGLLPYWFLVLCQLLIIGLYARVALSFSRGEIQPRLLPGRLLLGLGSVYVLAMIVRYVIRMSLYPDQRWFGGCLPIFFHLILASFLIIWGRYHWAYARPSTATV